MSKFVRFSFLVVIILSLPVFVSAEYAGDIDGDGTVDLDDLVLLAGQWLNTDCTANPSDCADIANTGDGVDLQDFALVAEYWLKGLTSVVINEFMAVNTSGLTDEDNESSDWIELYNPTLSTVDLKNWSLTDNAGNLNKWKFPDVQIGSGQYLVIFASGKDRRDPESELHTNFSLSGSGEYLALVNSDGIAAHEFSTTYPQQFGNVSYGLSTSTQGTSTETIFIPEDDTWRYYEGVTSDPSDPDDAWRMIGFNDNPATTDWEDGTAPLGYGDGFIVTNLPALDDDSSISSLYLRHEFTVTDTSAVNELRLDLFYDDGCIIWINGQEVERWAVTAGDKAYNDLNGEGYVDDAGWVPIPLSAPYSYLVTGTNVLAIHLLNSSITSSDIAIDAGLVATESEAVELTDLIEGYFTSPTPGVANNGVISSLGPAIRNVTEDPPRPGDGDDLVITAEVTETFDPISSVTLHYRVMYGSESSVAMYDDGVHGDGDAGDSVYGATIPASASGSGEMVRWYVTAEDVNTEEARCPLFPWSTDSPEYFGTVVADTSINTQLPLLEWFAQNEGSIVSGTRCSVYFLGKFYDNIYVHNRGGSTQAYSKKSFKFNFNSGHKFKYDPDEPGVNEINMNTTYSDKAYVRQTLAHNTYRDFGCPGSISFMVRADLNGSFYGVFPFIEEPEEELLDREGLDSRGALYKMYNTFYSGGSAEKKTRLWEGRSDLDDFCDNINGLTGSAHHNYLFDNVDLPYMMNYLVATVMVHQNDHPHKNHYLYRDSEGTGEWFFMPWDEDLTFGKNWIGTTWSDTLYADDDQVSGKSSDVKPSHPFIAKEDCREWNNFWNGLIDAVLNDSTAVEMFRRRLRTVMDEFLKAPGTSYSELVYENRLDDWVTQMGPDVALDYAKWADPWAWGSDQSWATAINYLKNDYLDVRRTHLFVTHDVDNAGSYPISGSYSAEIPNAQPASPTINIAGYDHNPSSYNQDEEYIELSNPNAYAVDISGWKLDNAVEHTFKPGTVIVSGGSIYVSPHVATFRARSTSPTGGEGRFVQGNYKGHLSSWGETIELYNNADALVDSEAYAGSPSDAQRYLRITEIMYHPQQGGSYNEEEYEYVELKNIGVSSLLLDNVKLSNGIYYAFADSAGVYLAAGDRIVIVKNQLAFAERYSTGGMNIAAGEYTGYFDNGGEDIKIDDHTNSTILEFDYNDDRYPITDGSGFSLTIVDETNSDLDSWDDMDNWHASSVVDGTPDIDDTGHVADNEAIVINEVLTHTDDLVYGDWIELHNTTGSLINIGGWFLSDNDNNFKKYKIASGVSIPGNGYIVFNSTETFRNASDPGSSVQFGLSELGEEVYLCSGSGGNLSGGYCIVEDFGVSANDVTFGRYVKSAASGYNVDFVAMSSITKGGVNSAPKVGPVVITELMYNSPDLDYQAEYIEIKNISGGTVLLYDSSYPSNTWKFTNGVDYTFPTGISLANNEYLLITRDDPTSFRSRYETEWSIPGGVTILGPYDGKLDNGGEKLDLSMPNDPDPGTGDIEYIRVDRVNYNDEAPWPVTADGEGDSLDRITDSSYGNDVANWQAASPTPGS